MFEPDVFYKDFGIEFWGPGYLVFVDGETIQFDTITEAKQFIDEMQKVLDDVVD